MSLSYDFAQNIVALSERLRHVQTFEGAKYYGLPIGSLITADKLHPHIRSLSALNELPVGSRVNYTNVAGAVTGTYTKLENGSWENLQQKIYPAGALSSYALAGKITLKTLPGEAGHPKKSLHVNDLVNAKVGTKIRVKVIGGALTYTKNDNGDWVSELNGSTYHSVNFKGSLDEDKVSFIREKKFVSDLKFEVLDDPGTSGDGYYSPGLWGKYGAAGVLIRHVDTDGYEHFLVVQRGPTVSSNKGKWQLPGGALDSKENPYQGTARETVEELQAPASFIAGLVPVNELIFEKGGWKYTNITADSSTMFSPVVDGTETGDAKWVSREDLAKLELHPALAKNLQGLLAQFTPVKKSEPVTEVAKPAEEPLAEWEKALLNYEQKPVVKQVGTVKSVADLINAPAGSKVHFFLGPKMRTFEKQAGDVWKRTDGFVGTFPSYEFEDRIKAQTLIWDNDFPAIKPKDIKDELLDKASVPPLVVGQKISGAQYDVLPQGAVVSYQGISSVHFIKDSSKVTGWGNTNGESHSNLGKDSAEKGKLTLVSLPETKVATADVVAAKQIGQVNSMTELNAAPVGTKVQNKLGTSFYTKDSHSKWISEKTGKVVNLQHAVVAGNMEYVSIPVVPETAVEKPVTSGLTEAEFNVLPIGSIIEHKSNGSSFERVSNFNWKNVETGETVEAYKIIYSNFVVAYNPKSFVTKSIPEVLSSEKTKNPLRVLKLGTSVPAFGAPPNNEVPPLNLQGGLSSEQFKALPNGSKINIEFANTPYYTKISGSKWEMADGGSANIGIDEYLTSYFLSSVTLLQYGTFLSDTSELTLEQFKTLPAGTELGYKDLDNTYIKQHDGTWINSQGNIAIVSPSKDTISNWYLKKLGAPAFIGSGATEFTVGDKVTEEQLPKLPAGTQLQSDKDGSVSQGKLTITKLADGTWSSSFSKTPQNKIPVKPAVQYLHISYLPGGVQPDKPVFVHLGYSVGDKISGAQFDALPVGAVIQESSKYSYTKLENGKWGTKEYQYGSVSFDQEDKVYEIVSLGTPATKTFNESGTTYTVPFDSKIYQSKKANDGFTYVVNADGTAMLYQATSKHKITNDSANTYNQWVASGYLVEIGSSGAPNLTFVISGKTYSVPAGSSIYVTKHKDFEAGLKYAKYPNGEWHQFSASGDTKFEKDSSEVVEDLVSTGEVILDDTIPGNTIAASIDTPHTFSVDKLVAAPAGTVIAHINSSFSATKNDDGTWTTSDAHAVSCASGTFYSVFLEADSVNGVNSSWSINKPLTTEQKTIPEGNFWNAPIGTVLVKKGSGLKWTKTESWTNSGDGSDVWETNSGNPLSSGDLWAVVQHDPDWSIQETKSVVKVVPHPSGLAPGKYSTSATSKVYFVILDNGQAFYVDKKGVSKPLSPKAVQAYHDAGLDYYGGTYVGALPDPAVEAPTGPVVFTANQGTQIFEVPAGSKVYHLAQKTSATALTKFVLYPDGTWSRTGVKDENGQVHLLKITDAGPTQQYNAYVKDKKLVLDKSAKATVLPVGPKILEGTYPFEGPPEFGYETGTNKLKAEMVKLANSAGYKNIAALNRVGMSDDNKKEWLKAWYNGNWDVAYEIERQAGAGLSEDAKPQSVQELLDAPTGTKILWVNDKKINNTYFKLENGNWSTYEGGGFSSENFYNYYGTNLRMSDKVIHPKADKHPGSPDNPANINGFQKINFGAAVAGELPAGTKVSGLSIPDDLSLAIWKWTPDQVDAYLLAAGMHNSHGLETSQKKDWIDYHRKGLKLSTDRLSVRARDNVKAGMFFSPEITPPKPIVEHGQSIELTGNISPFNTGSSHAVNLSDTQADEYVKQLFSPKASATVLQQSVETKKAIVQLHWLTTVPTTAGAYKTQEQATEEFKALKTNIELQVAAKPKDYYGNITDFALTLPPVNKVTAWKKSEKQKNFKGAFAKYLVEDDAGKVYFFKPAKENWRAQIADSAHKTSKLFGFNPAWSDLIEVDGTYGQVQGLLDNTGDLRDVAPQDLTDMEFVDLMKEHVFDWVTGQDDSHWEQFLRLPNGHLLHIDMDRAWYNTDGDLNNSENMQLSLDGPWKGPHIVETPYYKDVFGAIVDGKIDSKLVQKGYKAALAKARFVSKVSDEKYTEILKAGPLQNTNLSESQKENLLTEALARKNSAVSDMEKFWTSVFEKSGIEKPLPSTVPESPGLHSGFTQELLADVKASRNWGHATFFSGQDLEDGHVIVWEEQANGAIPSNFNGQMQLLSKADQKMVSWLNKNYSGAALGSNTDYEALNSLNNQSYYAGIVKKGHRTIEYHIQQNDFKYNAQSLSDMETVRQQMQAELDTGSYENLYPELPKKIAAHKEMLEHYLKMISGALAAKESSVAPPIFSFYKYVPQSEDEIKLKPVYNISKRYSRLHVAQLDSDTNILKATNDISDDGQSGQEYVIDIDGIEVIYRPWEGTNLSQQGLLRFRKEDYNDNVDYGSRVMEFLRNEVGIDAGEATDEDLELLYWRMAFGIIQDRADSGDAPQSNVISAVQKDDPRLQQDKSAELLRWREVWSELQGSEVVDNWVASQGYLPRFSKTTIQDPENVHGRPYWMRFDVDVAKLRLTKQFLARSMNGMGGGDSSNANSHVMRALKSGGVIPGEERARIVGRWIGKSTGDGGSAEGDQEKGSSGFTMNRANIESSPYQIYFDPALFARLSTYSFGEDTWGNINSRKHGSYWNINKASGRKGGSNEVVVKYGDTILSDAALVVFYDEEQRKKALDFYSSLGITHISGNPIEKVFVVRGNREQGLKDAHAAMKARVLGGDSYVPPASTYISGASIQTSGTVISDQELEDALVGTVVKAGLSLFTKNANGHWDSIGGGVWGSNQLLSNGKLEWVTVPTQTELPNYVTNVSQLWDAPIGSKIVGANGITYTKNGSNGWDSVDGDTLISGDLILENDSYPHSSTKKWNWEFVTAKSQVGVEGQKVTSYEAIKNAPIGTQVQYADSESTYEKASAGFWSHVGTGMQYKNRDFKEDAESSDSELKWKKIIGISPPVSSSLIGTNPKSHKELDTMPAGTILESVDGAWWKKKEGGKWEGSHAGNGYATDSIKLTLYKYKTIPGGGPVFSLPTVGETPKSYEELKSMPAGTVLFNSGYTWTKQENGTWTGSGYGLGGTEQSIDFPSYDYKTIPEAASSPVSHFEIKQGGIVNSTDELNNAPIGTVVTYEYKNDKESFTKYDGGSWISNSESGNSYEVNELEGYINNDLLMWNYIPPTADELVAGATRPDDFKSKEGDKVGSLANMKNAPLGTQIYIPGAKIVYTKTSTVDKGLWGSNDSSIKVGTENFGGGEQDWVFKYIPQPEVPQTIIEKLILNENEIINAPIGAKIKKIYSLTYNSDSSTFTKVSDHKWVNDLTGEHWDDKVGSFYGTHSFEGYLSWQTLEKGLESKAPEVIQMGAVDTALTGKVTALKLKLAPTGTIVVGAHTTFIKQADGKWKSAKTGKLFNSMDWLIEELSWA